MDSPVRLTLPLSGRQGAWGGVAEILLRPVHSRGLFEVLYQPRHQQLGHVIDRVDKHTFSTDIEPFALIRQYSSTFKRMAQSR